MSKPDFLVKDGNFYPYIPEFAAMAGFDVPSPEQVKQHLDKINKRKTEAPDPIPIAPLEGGEALEQTYARASSLEKELAEANALIAERDQTILDLNERIAELEVASAHCEAGTVLDMPLDQSAAENSAGNPDLEAMSHAELDDHAASLGMTPFRANTNKADKIAAIEAHVNS